MGLSSLQDFEDRYVRPNPGRTLIVGSKVYGDKPDRRFLHADAVGVDMQPGEGVDVVMDLEDASLAASLGQFDHVECISVLEHCERPWKMAATIEGLMREGATIFVSVPFVWRLHSYPGDYWRLTPEGLIKLFPGIAWETVGLAGEKLRIDGERLGRIIQRDYPFFARTETVGFGVRK